MTERMRQNHMQAIVVGEGGDMGFKVNANSLEGGNLDKSAGNSSK